MGCAGGGVADASAGVGAASNPQSPGTIRLPRKDAAMKKATTTIAVPTSHTRGLFSSSILRTRLQHATVRSGFPRVESWIRGRSRQGRRLARDQGLQLVQEGLVRPVRSPRHFGGWTAGGCEL